MNRISVEAGGHVKEPDWVRYNVFGSRPSEREKPKPKNKVLQTFMTHPPSKRDLHSISGVRRLLYITCACVRR